MDELVGIAIVACVLHGNFLEGAIVSAIMMLGSLVEEAVSDSARNAIRSLMEATPDIAVIEKNGEGRPRSTSRRLRWATSWSSGGGINHSR